MHGHTNVKYLTGLNSVSTATEPSHSAERGDYEKRTRMRQEKAAFFWDVTQRILVDIYRLWGHPIGPNFQRQAVQEQ